MFAGQVRAGDVLKDLDHLAMLSQKASQSLSNSVAERLSPSATNVAVALARKLNDTSISETNLGIYVWALGLCGTSERVPTITNLAERAQMPALRDDCHRALAAIGGNAAGLYLLTVLDRTEGKNERYDLLSLLGQMQCETALPKTIEILQSEPSSDSRRPVFVFGKMGDKAVPFLVDRIGDTNRNVRYNAINVLGQWMLAPASCQALQEQFWKETDQQVRMLLLSSLEQVLHGDDCIPSQKSQANSPLWSS